MRIKNKFLQLWLIIGIIAGFVTIIFFVITYLNEKILCNLECREKNEVLLVLILLSLFGLFIGSLSYYFISEKYLTKIVKINKDSKIILDFLEPDMKKILNSIIEKNGITSQSEIVKDTNMPRVKISRILSKLEQKDLITKKQKGMTNEILLKKELQDVFLK
jgi:predicted transcriptional regulator